MLEVDFHSHTACSCCGLHTMIEMLEKAKALGMKGLAITDHGEALDGQIKETFFRRLQGEPVPGVKLLKGIEANFLPEPGKIDCPENFIPFMDVILVGLHWNVERGQDAAFYTDLIVRGIEAHPYIDIITHLNGPLYDINFEPVVEAAKKAGVAIELNNSKCQAGSPGAAHPGRTMELINTCKKLECPMAISSDAHAVSEIGQDGFARPLMSEVSFPELLIVNRNADAAFQFVENNRAKRQ